MKYLLLAISFLTVFPVKLTDPPEEGDSGRSAIWFPFIGLVIGGICAFVLAGLNQIVSPILAAVLTGCVWIGCSGGLHLDGLADCSDGMLHASNPGRRLEIMKDPRLGTFGGIGLIVAILMKIAMLYSLNQSVIIWLPLAAGMGRWMLLPMGKQPLARAGGMAQDFSTGLSRRIILGGLAPMVLMIALAGWRGVAAAASAHLAGWVIAWISRYRLGGITGDVLGLTVECVELVVLFAACV